MAVTADIIQAVSDAQVPLDDRDTALVFAYAARELLAATYPYWNGRLDNAKLKLFHKLNAQYAFCPTGEGGGIDNSCPPGNKDDDQGDEFLNEELDRVLADNGVALNSGEASIVIEHSLQWQNDLEDLESSAVDYYTGSGYIQLNSCLRGKKDCDSQDADLASQLDKALSKASFPTDVVVHRGIRYEPELEEKLKVGALFEDKGFVSTSLSSDQIIDTEIIFEIIVPKGAKAAYLDGVSQHPDELEVLISRGSLFKITSVEKFDEKTIVKAELLHETQYAFCPTGEGGGIDNSCPPGNKSADELNREVDQVLTDRGVTIGRSEATAVIEHSLQWRAGIQQSEAFAIARYTSTEAFYKRINGCLRGLKKCDSTVEDLTSRLDKALSKASFPANVTVYRGIDFVPELEGKLKVGSVFEDKGFVSTSLSFMKVMPSGGSGKRILFEITIPKGAKAAYLDGLSDVPNELEVLINRGAKFKITDVNKHGRNAIIKAELLT